MRFRVRRRSHPQNDPRPVYVVSCGQDVDQVFSTLQDAERFARDRPAAQVRPHPVRRSVDEAAVVYERRVVVTDGETVLDRAEVAHRFIDDPHDTPDPADVEWFHDTTDRGWHIVGFGIDKAALDARMQETVALVRRLSQTSTIEVAR